jgi:hypothetical protein
MTLAVEADQRNEEQIDRPGEVDTPVAKPWLLDSEDIPGQGFSWAVMHEPEFFPRVRPKHRQQAPFVSGMGEAEHWGGVELAIGTTVRGDAVCFEEQRVLSEQSLDTHGVLALLGGGEVAAPRA